MVKGTHYSLFYSYFSYLDSRLCSFLTRLHSDSFLYLLFGISDICVLCTQQISSRFQITVEICERNGFESTANCGYLSYTSFPSSARQWQIFVVYTILSRGCCVVNISHAVIIISYFTMWSCWNSEIKSSMNTAYVVCETVRMKIYTMRLLKIGFKTGWNSNPELLFASWLFCRFIQATLIHHLWYEQS